VPHSPADELALVAAGRVVDGEVGRPPHHAFPGQLAAHGLDDVTAFAHAAEHRLEVGGKLPAPGSGLLGQTQAAQLLQPAGSERLEEGVAGNRPLVGFAQQAAVEAGEAFLLHLRPQPGLDLAVGPGPEIQGDDLGPPLARALAQILPRDDEVGAAIVLAAQDDMAVGLPGVEAELMAVAVGPLEEGGTAGPVQLRIVEVAGQPLAADAVALEIAQMSPGSFETSAGQLDDPRLDHDAVAAERGVAITRREHASDAGAAPDPAAVESAAARGRAALAPALERDRALDLTSEAAADPAAARTNPAELWLEIVVARHGRASRVGSEG
jgi:hypothetical protein